MDGCGQSSDAEGQPVMKPFWEMTEEDERRCLEHSHREPCVTLILNILENALTIGFVMSLAKPQRAKQVVMSMKGRT